MVEDKEVACRRFSEIEVGVGVLTGEEEASGDDREDCKKVLLLTMELGCCDKGNERTVPCRNAKCCCCQALTIDTTKAVWRSKKKRKVLQHLIFIVRALCCRRLRPCRKGRTQRFLCRYPLLLHNGKRQTSRSNCRSHLLMLMGAVAQNRCVSVHATRCPRWHL